MAYFYTYSYYTYKLPLYGICFSVHDTAAGITPNRVNTEIDVKAINLMVLTCKGKIDIIYLQYFKKYAF